MKRLLYSLTLIAACGSLVEGNIRIVIPADNQELEGYRSTDIPIKDDSVIDFSDISRYGESVNWRYMHSGDTAIVEHRGSCWRRYLICGDTVMLSHTEDYRERSDFNFAIPMAGQDSVIYPYLATSRRDMTFCYADSGTVNVNDRTAGLLILAEGDTIAGQMCLETSRTFIRHNAETGQPLGTITDTERTWHAPGSPVPLAYTHTRTTEANGRQPLTASESYVFPRSSNADSSPENPARTVTRENPGDAGARGKMSIGDNDTPTVILTESVLSVHAQGDADISVCDVSGRVWRNVRTSGGETTIPLSGLPDGEYVVTVDTAGSLTSTTIIYRH